MGGNDIIQVDETETISISGGDLYEEKNVVNIMLLRRFSSIFIIVIELYKGYENVFSGISNGTSYRNRYKRAY